MEILKSMDKVTLFAIMKIIKFTLKYNYFLGFVCSICSSSICAFCSPLKDQVRNWIRIIAVKLVVVFT